MRRSFLLIQIVIACAAGGASAASLKCGKINGAQAKTLRFPKQIKFSSLRGGQAKATFKTPSGLKVTVGRAQIVNNEIALSALLTNTSSQPFSLVVNPYGGRFPYGGNNPLTLGFSRAANKVVKYSGKLYPPGPPSPMVIEIPAASCVQFDAKIELKRYSYEGSPKVTLNWGFHYFRGKYPKGRVDVVLPKR